MHTPASGRSRTRASWRCSTVLSGCSSPRTAPASGASTMPFAGGRQWSRARELAQRGLEQRGELGFVAELFAGDVERGLGVSWFVAEVDQGGVNVIIDGDAR